MNFQSRDRKKLEKISIVGLGGHAKVVLDAIKSCGFSIDGYFDVKITQTSKLNYLGKENLFTSGFNIFITVGDNGLRKKIYDTVKSKNNLDFCIIHPSTHISPSALIGKQSFLAPGCVVNADVEIETGVIINSNATVEHDSRIGEFSHIAPGTTLCGGVNIGINCLVGANSTVLPGINIGDNVIVGAGSVVNRDLESNSIYIGNPLIKIK